MTRPWKFRRSQRDFRKNMGNTCDFSELFPGTRYNFVEIIFKTFFLPVILVYLYVLCLIYNITVVRFECWSFGGRVESDSLVSCSSRTCTFVIRLALAPTQFATAVDFDFMVALLRAEQVMKAVNRSSRDACWKFRRNPFCWCSNARALHMSHY